MTDCCSVCEEETSCAVKTAKGVVICDHCSDDIRDELGRRNPKLVQVDLDGYRDALKHVCKIEKRTVIQAAVVISDDGTPRVQIIGEGDAVEAYWERLTNVLIDVFSDVMLKRVRTLMDAKEGPS